MSNNKELAIVEEKDLALVEDNSLNAKQLQQLLKRTPSIYVKERPAKGGGTWKYVTGGYVKKALNLMFGWDWDFEIISEQVIGKEVIVKGKLTCRTAGREIVKMQFGNKDIAFKTEFLKDKEGKVIYENGKPKKVPSDEPLSLGNDFKAAATDCLKKCAAEIGIAADVYNAEEFREVEVKSTNYENIMEND